MFRSFPRNKASRICAPSSFRPKYRWPDASHRLYLATSPSPRTDRKDDSPSRLILPVNSVTERTSPENDAAKRSGSNRSPGPARREQLFDGHGADPFPAQLRYQFEQCRARLAPGAAQENRSAPLFRQCDGGVPLAPHLLGPAVVVEDHVAPRRRDTFLLHGHDPDGARRGHAVDEEIP